MIIRLTYDRMMWPAHPDDEWIEVTAYGDSEPIYVRGMSGAAAEVAEARAKYLADQITVEEFEAVFDRVLAA